MKTPARAACYHDRWEAETGIDQLKTHLRGPGRTLRSRTPDLARQETWAYLLTHWALATLICVAATTAGVDPDGIKFLATLRIVRRSVTDRAVFPPAHHGTLWTRTVHQAGRPRNRNPPAGTAATPEPSKAPDEAATENAAPPTRASDTQDRPPSRSCRGNLEPEHDR
ncbi:hypothetical protein [Nonomuraea turcica]|uniref:hypothetical protein n=1 Tax=Nonomuraea sp. G32 TaxID=3067274 RepID=UPI00273BF40F|nr:hypothetical protein [Nonomuraea sp. G32]MDP4510624.1 hypothetical protein [Nonomuraea sp. G32]